MAIIETGQRVFFYQCSARRLVRGENDPLRDFLTQDRLECDGVVLGPGRDGQKVCVLWEEDMLD